MISLIPCNILVASNYVTRDYRVRNEVFIQKRDQIQSTIQARISIALTSSNFSSSYKMNDCLPKTFWNRVLGRITKSSENKRG